LKYLGAVVGVAGILSVLLGSITLMSVNGLGLIVWLAWLGIAMLRPQSAQPGERSGTSDAVDLSAPNRS
jgi:threonine/homoserine/homoserine lactone efflux protein